MSEITELASVIEPSKTLEITYEPLSIVTNVEGVEAFVNEIIRPFEESELDISTKELEKHARDSISDLNKLLDALDKQRIEEVREISRPITEVDKALKDVIGKGKAAYRRVKDLIDAKVLEQQEARKTELEADYEGMVGEKTVKSIPFEKIANKSWFTKSYGDQKSYNEMCAEAERVVKDMKRLSDQPLNNRAQVLAYYCETLDLGKALDEDERITRERVEADRKAREAEEAFKLKPEPKPEPVPEVKPAAKDVEHELSDYAFIVKGISVFDAKTISEFIETLTGSKPPAKSKAWIERVGA